MAQQQAGKCGPKYHMEDCPMSLKKVPTQNYEQAMTISEIMFGALLGIGAISFIWVSTTLLIHLYQKLY